MSVSKRRFGGFQNIPELRHKEFLAMLEVELNIKANRRAGVLYMRTQVLAYGIAKVEYFANNSVDDCVLYYHTGLHAPAGNRNLTGKIVGAWHLADWGSASIDVFGSLELDANRKLDEAVRFFEPGVLKAKEFTVRKAA